MPCRSRASSPPPLEGTLPWIDSSFCDGSASSILLVVVGASRRIHPGAAGGLTDLAVFSAQKTLLEVRYGRLPRPDSPVHASATMGPRWSLISVKWTALAA